MNGMKTIGVLGGFGPEATTVFEDQVHAEARRLLPPRFNQGYPPMITVHLRHAPILLEEGAPPRGPLRIDPRVLEVAAWLGGRADFLVIVANTPHLFVDEIAAAAGCEVLSMVDLVVEEIRRRGSAAGSATEPAPIGLLGLGVPQAYVERFGREEIRFQVAPEKVRAALDDAILRTLELSTTEVHREAARQAVESLRRSGATTTILGCTEIPLLLGPEATAEDLVDPGRLLARGAVRRALGLEDR